MKLISEYMDEAILEFIEERAAILEYEAGYPREKAEALATAEAASWIKHREGQCTNAS